MKNKTSFIDEVKNKTNFTNEVKNKTSYTYSIANISETRLDSNLVTLGSVIIYMNGYNASPPPNQLNFKNKTEYIDVISN